MPSTGVVTIGVPAARPSSAAIDSPSQSEEKTSASARASSARTSRRRPRKLTRPSSPSSAQRSTRASRSGPSPATRKRTGTPWRVISAALSSNRRWFFWSTRRPTASTTGSSPRPSSASRAARVPGSRRSGTSTALWMISRRPAGNPHAPSRPASSAETQTTVSTSLSRIDATRYSSGSTPWNVASVRVAPRLPRARVAMAASALALTLCPWMTSGAQRWMPAASWATAPAAPTTERPRSGRTIRSTPSAATSGSSGPDEPLTATRWPRAIRPSASWITTRSAPPTPRPGLASSTFMLRSAVWRWPGRRRRASGGS